MRRNIVLRGALGFPIGIAIGYLITILTSLIWGEGYYLSCRPELVSIMGNEINAVMLQTLLCGLLGAGCAAGSVIWEIDHWSMAKQTGIYFLMLSVLMLPIAYFTNWMEHSSKGFLSYFTIFTLIFAGIWIIQFLMNRQIVRKMNANLSQGRRDVTKS